MAQSANLKRARTSVLEIAYEESGPAGGVPVFLMLGFPYDPRTYDAVVPPLNAAGCRTIVPYLRGYGPTRFLAADTPRSGEQAALGNDLKELMDALAIERAVLAGYDWGGRAACVVAAFAAWFLPTATTSTTLPARPNRWRPNRSSGSGTNIISTPSAAAPDCRPIGAHSASCCGDYGRRTGSSTRRPSSGPPRRSTIRTSSRW